MILQDNMAHIVVFNIVHCLVNNVLHGPAIHVKFRSRVSSQKLHLLWGYTPNGNESINSLDNFLAIFSILGRLSKRDLDPFSGPFQDSTPSLNLFALRIYK